MKKEEDAIKKRKRRKRRKRRSQMKRRIKRLISLIFLALFFIGLGKILLPKDVQEKSIIKYINKIVSKDSKEKYINGILLVNKEFALSKSYNPGENFEAREAFEIMKSEAELDGIYLTAFSTFRNYDDQHDLYYEYVEDYGEEMANEFSAMPGFSEHQTGLAFDIGGINKGLWAEDDFQYEDEAIWLKENAYKYGFILRYPEGKEGKTGYMYESWHFRYIGKDNSIYFKGNDLTLEEYLKLVK